MSLTLAVLRQYPLLVKWVHVVSKEVVCDKNWKYRTKEYDISTFLWFPGCILFFGYCKHYLENVDFISWVLLETRRCIFTNFCVEVLYPMDFPEELWFQANCECFAPAVSILLISNMDFSVFVCIFKCFVCFLVQFFVCYCDIKKGFANVHFIFDSIFSWFDFYSMSESINSCFKIIMSKLVTFHFTKFW